MTFEETKVALLKAAGSHAQWPDDHPQRQVMAATAELAHDGLVEASGEDWMLLTASGRRVLTMVLAAEKSANA